MREVEKLGDPLNRLWKDCIFDFCGISIFDRMMFRVVADSSHAGGEEWLNQTKDMVNHYFPQGCLQNVYDHMVYIKLYRQ